MFAKSKLSLIFRLLAVSTAAWLPIAACSARACCFSCSAGSLVQTPRHCCHSGSHSGQSLSTDRLPKCPQEVCHCSQSFNFTSSLNESQSESLSDSLDLVIPAPQLSPTKSDRCGDILKTSRSSTQTCAILCRFLC